ncbi:MAG: glycosyltransferase family 2 protein [Candidatus Binataceae bacterium]
MKFSLILATVGRVKDLERYLESLDQQIYRDFELLVVDQNPDDRLVPMIARFGGRFEIRHLRSERGLSRARNVALPLATGDAIAFPDDDCVYPAGLLAQVAALLEANPNLDGISGRCLTERGTPRGRWPESRGLIRKYNIFGRCISFTMFLRRELAAGIGPFDEALGLGAKTAWLGAEDYDYLLRAALRGAVLYDPRVEVFHPALTAIFNEDDRAKRYGNALGFGRFLAKHHYPLVFVAFYSGRYLAGAVWNLAKGQVAKAHYRWTAMVGNFEGWFST